MLPVRFAASPTLLGFGFFHFGLAECPGSSKVGSLGTPCGIAKALVAPMVADGLHELHTFEPSPLTAEPPPPPTLPLLIMPPALKPTTSRSCRFGKIALLQASWHLPQDGSGLTSRDMGTMELTRSVARTAQVCGSQLGASGRNHGKVR